MSQSAVRQFTLALICLMMAAALPAAHAQTAAPKPRPARPHTHARTHFYFGTVFVPGMVIYPRPLPPRTIYAPPAQTVYVEKKELEAESDTAAYAWYFCQPLKIYYPYTLDCPEAWTRVTPPAEAGKTATP